MTELPQRPSKAAKRPRDHRKIIKGTRSWCVRIRYQIFIPFSAICQYCLSPDTQLKGHFISNLQTPPSYLLVLSINGCSTQGSFYIKYSYPLCYLLISYMTGSIYKCDLVQNVTLIIATFHCIMDLELSFSLWQTFRNHDFVTPSHTETLLLFLQGLITKSNKLTKFRKR